VYPFFVLFPDDIRFDVLAGAVTVKGQERLVVPAEEWVFVVCWKRWTACEVEAL